MNTQTNSFRLPRLANTIQLRKKSASNFEPYPLEPVKLASFHAVNRSVKYNDLSFVTGRDLNKLRKQPQQSDNIQYESAHDNLTTTRKKYDNIGKQRAEKDQEVTQLTDQRNKFKSLQDEFLANKEKANKQVSNLQAKLNEIKYDLDQTETEKKVLFNMVNRIKTDKVTYDQRKFNLEKELVFLKKQKNIIIQESSGQSEEDDRTKKVYAKLIKQLEAEQKQRQEHIRSLETMLEEKMAIQQKNQIRKREMIQVAEEALQDKDSSQKNWEKIYLCHRFVQKLLREKMNTEMNKFSTVEVAFKNIKTATGVNDGQTLVSKFLNKEVVYGELLGKIAENQKKITFLKQQNEEMTKERKALKEQRSLYYITKKDQTDDEGTKQIKDLENANQKLVTCQLFQSKIKGWLLKNEKKFNAIDNKNENIEKTGFIQQFKTYLKLLSSSVDSLNAKDDLSTNESQLSDPVIPNDRIFRVKPKVKKLNASKEEIENEFQEEQIQNAYEDDDCINTQRAELLRNNDKFMKQLKKKYEEIKKAKIQAAPKVKQDKPKVAPPPPAND